MANPSELLERPREIRADDPVGRVVQEGVVVLGLHELALDELELRVLVEAVAGPGGHAVAEDEVGSRVEGHGTVDGIGLELQRGLLQ